MRFWEAVKQICPAPRPLDEEIGVASLQLVETLPSGSDDILLKRVNNFETRDNIHDWEMFTKYSLWYLGHLQQRIDRFIGNQDWQIPLERILPGLSEFQTPIRREVISRELNQVLRVICETIHSGQSSLSTIASQLGRPSQLDTESEAESLPDNRTVDPTLHQLLFTLISWVFMLYTSASVPPPGVLRLELKDLDDIDRQVHTAAWRQLSCQMTEDKLSLTLENLLRCFGDFEPKSPPQPLYANRSLFFEDSIISGNLSYWTLQKVAGLHIEWVDAVSLHLEFDEKTLALKVFRFPSFCAMLAIPRDTGSTIFQKIFEPPSKDDSSGTSDEHQISPYTQDFFMEVLCTYRLLFGQHPRARYLYRRADSTKSALSITGTDPLLRELCGSSHNKSRLFDCINAFPAKIVHSARSDFPYLGRRLVKLHQYVINQNPSDLTALWYDRRDLNRFYTFWAVVLVGGISLFLSFVQVLLSAVQVWEGRKL